MNRKILKLLVRETLKSLNESKFTSEILNSSFKNARYNLGTNAYEVPSSDFKLEVEKQLSFLKGKISDDERYSLEDFLESVSDSGTFSPKDLFLAIKKLDTSSPDVKKELPIDMKSLPLPHQVNVQKILSDLSIKYPSIFGIASESDSSVLSLVSSFNPADKKYFTHGMQIGSDNVYGERKRIFAKDAAGNNLFRPDGSVIFFYVRPKTPINAIYDVYTSSFVSEDVFYKRENIYRILWREKLLPSPETMARSRQVKASKI